MFANVPTIMHGQYYRDGTKSWSYLKVLHISHASIDDDNDKQVYYIVKDYR